MGKAASPCVRAKPATGALPRVDNIQNVGWLGAAAAEIAVDSDRSPMKTIECAR